MRGLPTGLIQKVLLVMAVLLVVGGCVDLEYLARISPRFTSNVTEYCYSPRLDSFYSTKGGNCLGDEIIISKEHFSQRRRPAGYVARKPVIPPAPTKQARTSASSPPGLRYCYSSNSPHYYPRFGSCVTGDQVISRIDFERNRPVSPSAPSRPVQASSPGPSKSRYCYNPKFGYFYDLDGRNYSRANATRRNDSTLNRCAKGDIAVTKDAYTKKKKPFFQPIRAPRRTKSLVYCYNSDLDVVHRSNLGSCWDDRQITKNEFDRIRSRKTAERRLARRPVASQAPPKQAQTATTSPTAVDTSPPAITVPKSLQAKTGSIEIAGRVSDDSKIVSVLIAGKAIPHDTDGSFRVSRYVPPGGDTVRVEAVDEWNNRSQTEVRITRTSQQSRVGQLPNTGLDFGRYHALVIGNVAYGSLPQLETAVNDAVAVGNLLRNDYGFEVVLLTNATRDTVIQALDSMRRRLTENDNLLVYYAGHGQLDPQADRGYWLPVDATEDSRARWLSNADVTDTLKAISAKHVMVVADSCYSGTLTRSAKRGLKLEPRTPDYITKMLGKKTRTALTSGGLEPVVDRGGEGHSVFAKAFLDALGDNKGVMDGTQMFTRVRQQVRLNADQTPQYSNIRLAGHEVGGDFLFVRRK
jgi:hypothetical protein